MQRYIDLEHADAEVRCLICDNRMKSEKGCDGSCHYDEDLFNKIMEIIDKLSTIEAEPVRKGRWIHKPDRYEETWICSECGEKTVSSVLGNPRYNYCPMCGALMQTKITNIETCMNCKYRKRNQYAASLPPKYRCKLLNRYVTLENWCEMFEMERGKFDEKE